VAKPGDNLVLVLDDGDEPHAAIKALAPFFGEARRGELVTLSRGGSAVATRRLWLLARWRGGWPN
jgi:hypothetical protein